MRVVEPVHRQIFVARGPNVTDEADFARRLSGARKAASNATYAILNSCRVLAFQDDGRILSKDEGGVWGLAHLPSAHHALIALALAEYRANHNPRFDADAVAAFMNFAQKYW